MSGLLRLLERFMGDVCLEPGHRRWLHSLGQVNTTLGPGGAATLEVTTKDQYCEPPQAKAKLDEARVPLRGLGLYGDALDGRALIGLRHRYRLA